MIRHKSRLAIAILLMACIGCAGKTWTKNTYDVLSVSGNSYEMARATVIRLYHDGVLTDADRDLAIKLSADFADAYNAAITAVQAFIDGTGTNTTVEDKIKAYSKASGAFFSFITPIVERKVTK